MAEVSERETKSDVMRWGALGTAGVRTETEERPEQADRPDPTHLHFLKIALAAMVTMTIEEKDRIRGRSSRLSQESCGQCTLPGHL